MFRTPPHLRERARFRSKYLTNLRPPQPNDPPPSNDPPPPELCVLCKVAMTTRICQGEVCQTQALYYRPNHFCEACETHRKYCPACIISHFFRGRISNGNNPQAEDNNDEDESFSDWEVTPSDLDDCSEESSYGEYIKYRIREGVCSGMTVEEHFKTKDLEAEYYDEMNDTDTS
jgi:hypothetical protein